MSPSVVRVAVALSGGVDSAVAALFLERCVPQWCDVEALWGLKSPLPLDEVKEALERRRPCSQLRAHVPARRSCHDPAATVHYFPLFMRNWEDGVEESEGRRWCEASQQDYYDATDAARLVGLLRSGELLPLQNFSACYVQTCFEPMLNAYARGKTLNVDVLCNTEVKFNALFHALHTAWNAEYIATGHYARTVPVPSIEAAAETVPRGCVVARPFSAGRDLNDQTVFLSRLSRLQASRAIFPLGHVFEQKADVRAVAAYFGLTRLSAKKTSTGLCFVGNHYRRGGGGGGFCRFLNEYITPNSSAVARLTLKGEQTRFVNAQTGESVEASKLLIPWGGNLSQSQKQKPSLLLLPAYSLTLGQQIRGRNKNGIITRYYVQNKELFPLKECEERGAAEETESVRYLHTVQLVDRWDHPLLYSAVTELHDVTLSVHPRWLGYGEGEGGKMQLQCYCCARHQEPLRPAILYFSGYDLHEAEDGCVRVARATVVLDEPIRALTAGQALVAYLPLPERVAAGAAGWFVLASGWISSSQRGECGAVR